MKTIDNIFEKLISLDNLREAYYSSRKGKTNKYYIKQFDKQNINDKLLIALENSLRTQQFKPSRHTYFEMLKPKKRTIAKLPYYPDRIFQHAIVNVLRDYWKNLLGKNTYACVRKRGVLGKEGMYHDLKSLLYQNKPKYCLKIDIRRYYENISHDILKNILRHQINDQQVLDLIFLYIDNYHFTVSKGLAVGSILSQYLSNIYLCRFDYNIKKRYRKYGVYYFRYNDDMVFVGDDKDTLWSVLEYAEEELNKLELSLSNKQLFPIDIRGIDVGGVVYYNTHIGLRRRIKYRIQRRYNQYKSPKNINEYFAGWKGYIMRTDSVHFLRVMGMDKRQIDILKNHK